MGKLNEFEKDDVKSVEFFLNLPLGTINLASTLLTMGEEIILESILDMFSGIFVSIFSIQEVVSFCTSVFSSSREDAVKSVRGTLSATGREEKTESYDLFSASPVLAAIFTPTLVGSPNETEYAQLSE